MIFKKLHICSTPKIPNSFNLGSQQRIECTPFSFHLVTKSSPLSFIILNLSFAIHGEKSRFPTTGYRGMGKVISLCLCKLSNIPFVLSLLGLIYFFTPSLSHSILSYLIVFPSGLALNSPIVFFPNFYASPLICSDGKLYSFDISPVPPVPPGPWVGLLFMNAILLVYIPR